MFCSVERCRFMCCWWFIGSNKGRVGVCSLLFWMISIGVRDTQKQSSSESKNTPFSTRLLGAGKKEENHKRWKEKEGGGGGLFIWWVANVIIQIMMMMIVFSFLRLQIWGNADDMVPTILIQFHIDWQMSKWCQSKWRITFQGTGFQRQYGVSNTGFMAAPPSLVCFKQHSHT